MRRFHFRLDPALRVRKFREEQAQLVLASAQRKLADAEAEHSETLAAISRHREWRARAQQVQLDIRVLKDAAQYEENLLAQLEADKRMIMSATTEVTDNLEIIRKVHADREALDRLRERRLTEHYQEELASEQKDIDESSVLRWTRP